jgi:ATP-dependent Zn protease
MKISNRINNFLFLALACVSITQVPANTMAAEPDVTVPFSTAGHSNVADALLQFSMQQLSRLDQVAEHIARLINDRQIKSLKNPRLAMQSSTKIRSFLKELLATEQTLAMSQTEIKMNAISELIRVGQALTSHYKKALDTGFTQLKPFGLEEYKKISGGTRPSHQIDAAHLIMQIKNLDTQITKIEKRVENIGLTWYNTLARKIDNSILVPIERNNLRQILLTGALATIAGWYFISEYGGNLKDVTPEWMAPIIDKAQSTWGRPIPMKNDGTVEDDPATNQKYNIDDPTGAHGFTWRSRMAYSVKRSIKDPLTSVLIGSMSVYAYSMWDHIKEPFVKFAAQSWNKLRGGAYEKGKVSGIWNFEPTHGFDKVIGLDSLKSEFSVLLEFLKNPENSIRRGLIPAKAYLLTGDPGVGKTFAVEGLCGEINAVTGNAQHAFRFMKVDAPLIQEAGGISRILNYARNNAPCVIFIDEIDLLGLQRTGDNKMLSEFLTSMGNSIDNDPMKLVIIIAATNKPQMLDKALLRTGRFKEIRIEHPTHEARKLFLQKELSSYGLDTAQFDLEAFAQETDNHTIEDLRSVIRRGIITSWMIKVPLNQTILDYGMNKEIHHIMLEDQRNMPEHEQKLLAAYFAGRAFALNLFDTHEELAKVTIKPVMTKLNERTAWQEFFHKDLKEQATIEHGSIFTKPKRIDSLNVRTKQELLDMCKAYLAGTATQELLLDNSCVYQDNSDHNRAFICAHRYVLNGLDPEKLSADLQKQYQQQAHEVYNKCKKDVKAALKRHKNTLLQLADELQKKAILSGIQVKAIIEKNREVVGTSKKQNASRK